MINVYRFSSCRGVDNGGSRAECYGWERVSDINILNTQWLFHTTKEIIYFLKLLDRYKNNNRSVNSLLPNEDYFFNNIEQIKRSLKLSDMIYIEISSLAYYMDRYGNVGQVTRIGSETKAGNIKPGVFEKYTLTEDELVKDMAYLERYFKKPIIYTGHGVTIDTNCSPEDQLTLEREFKLKWSTIVRVMESRNLITKYIKRHAKYHLVISSILKGCKLCLHGLNHVNKSGKEVLNKYARKLIRKVKGV